MYRIIRLVFGTLYPAYASYKAVRTKNVKEYVKWMMYWIVFAIFTCIETFTDVFLSWFPFYYEIKIMLVIWLLSPATKGSSFLYRKFVHPLLSSREQEIDEYISKAKEQSYKQVLDLGSKGMTALMQTAIKGGGGIVNHLRKSYSLGDLSDPGLTEGQDERDVIITDPRLRRRRVSPHRSSSTSSAHIYFSEVDVRADKITHVQSTEDISSSGYSSGEGLTKLQAREGLTRTGSLTRSRTGRTTRSTVPKKTTGVASDESDENEVFDTNIIFLNDKVKAIDRLTDEKSESSSEEFGDALDTMHGNRPTLTAPELTRDACEKRGGRYNKRAAPVPPIKATLVLTPGVVKNVGVDSCKEVFVQSPKTKRRSSNSSGSSSKRKNRFSMLLKLPKKIGLWPSLADSKHSKSAGDLPTVDSSSTSRTSPCGSRLSIKSLTESPLSHRRLKIVRKLLDEDDD
ncbi:receptor expression-enhancing protein 2 isoform X3 [Aethina tumida]|uniref:receptor expression-enhancing protein 2 isoform X3 n=1 Tax=Aethina tumida TaxID=116153 RepID=UPI00096AE1E5|nr:receptor expression-enhancing protein 2 isoform X3 [Aethina tumida]